MTTAPSENSASESSSAEKPATDFPEPDRIIALDTAISRIRQVYEDTRGDSQRPYFFVVGAGISSPPISTSAAMTEHFQAKAKEKMPPEEFAQMGPFKRAVDAYSSWFQKAYEEPRAQQEFFAKIIEDLPLSQANHRLAHLLLPERDGGPRLANLVITPNFDDYLFRALVLFGCQPAPVVCDHPATTERITPLGEKIQIIHLHGTYQHYDLVNLPKKIAEAPMRDLVRTILMQKWAPLVIGYSCWPDAFWQEFERRLWDGDRERVLPNRCFWFCFTRRSIAELPERLRKHSQVVFVVPPAEREEPTVNEPIPPPWSGAPGFSQKASDPTTLPATQVLDALIHALGIGEPELTRNPIAFLIRHLGYSLPPEERQRAEPRSYFIARLQRQLGEFEKTWTETEDIIAGSKGVFSDMRSSRHEAAIVKIADICERLVVQDESEMRKLVGEHELKLRGPLRDLLDAAWSASIGLAGEARLEAEGHTRVCQLGELIEKYLGSVQDGRYDEGMFEQIAKSGLYLAIRRITSEAEALAIENLESIQNDFARKKYISIQRILAWAKLNEGAAHQRLFHFDEAHICYDHCEKNCHENSLGTEPQFFTTYNRALIAARQRETEKFLALATEVIGYVPDQNSVLASDISSCKHTIAEIKHSSQIVQENEPPTVPTPT